MPNPKYLNVTILKDQMHYPKKQMPYPKYQMPSPKFLNAQS